MAPNLRPTLSTRIRASFDGKGSKSNVQSAQETKTFIVQDAAILRDAIGQAINNDSFQNAIAAHLAKLIEPSIKEALDTIQPVVETVYQHEILLRKTNRSVEDLLQRFDSAAEKGDDFHGSDTVIGASKNFTGAEEIRKFLNEHKTHIDARFSELSSSVRRGHGTTSQAVTDIAEIKAALSLSSKSLESLKSTAQQSTTDTFKLQEQLDELKNDIGKVMRSMETQSTTLTRIKEADLATAEILGAAQESHASHTVALNEIKAQDQSFKSASVPIFEKSHADTATAFQTLTSNLASLKESIKAGFASEHETISSHRTKVDAVLSSVNDIYATSTSQEILAGVRKSNDFHTAHSTALENLKGRIVTKEPENVISNEHESLPALAEHLNAITTILESHTSSLSALQRRADPEFRLNNIATTLDSHTGHLATIKESEKSTDILAALRSSNEEYANHTKKLDEIKAVAEAVNESHASNAADIGEIKNLTKAAEGYHKAHTTELGEIKTAIADAGNSHTSHTKDLGELKSALTAGNDSHAAHAIALEVIKAANETAAQGTSSQLRSLEALETQMGTVIATLGSQSIVHSDIRDTIYASKEAHSSHSIDLGEIRSTVKAASDSHISHASALEAIKAKNETINEITTAQTESLASLESHIGTLNTNLQAQRSVYSEVHDAVRNSHTSHATALDGILSARAAIDRQIAAQSTALDAVGTQLGTIATDINHQNKTHSEVRDAIQASNASHASHTAALEKAETAHMDILGGLNGTKDFLAGHGKVLVSHAAMLEGVKAAHSKTHEDAMGHISALENAIDAHSSVLKDFQTETKNSHAQIKDSIKPLSDGVHLNEKGVGQFREHAVRAGYQNTEDIARENGEPAPRNVGTVTGHSFVNSKSALGLGMAAVDGGGLMAVAGKEVFFAHGEENAREAPRGEPADDKPSTIKGAHGVKEVEQAKPAEVEEHFREVEPSQAVEPVTEEPAIVEDQVYEELAQESESVQDVKSSVNELAKVAESVYEPEMAIESSHEAEPVHHDGPSVFKESFAATAPTYLATTEVEDVEPSKQVEESKPTLEHSQIQEVEPDISEPLHDKPSTENVISEAELIQDQSTSPKLVSEGPDVQDTAIEESVTEHASEPTIEEPVKEQVFESAIGELSTKHAFAPVVYEHFREAAREDSDFRDPNIKEPAYEPMVVEPAIKEPVLDETIVEEPIRDEPAHDLEPLNAVTSAHDEFFENEKVMEADHLQADDSINAVEPIVKAEPAVAIESAMNEPAHEVESVKGEPLPRVDTVRAIEPVHENNSILEPEPVHVLDSEVEPLYEAELATHEPILESEPLHEHNTTDAHQVPEFKSAHEAKLALNHSIIEDAAMEEPVSKTEHSEDQLIHGPAGDEELVPDESTQWIEAGHEEIKSATDERDKGESPVDVLAHKIEASTHVDPVSGGELVNEAEAVHEIEPGNDVASDREGIAPETEPITGESTLEHPIVERGPPASDLVMETEPITMANCTTENPAPGIESSAEGSSFEQVKSLPTHEDKKSTGDTTAQVTLVHEAESLHKAWPAADVKPASEIESALEELVSDQPAIDRSTVVEPTTTYRDILTELTAGKPAIGPVVAESSRKILAEEVEPRPALTKRVSFKEPLTEVKQATEPNPVAEEAIEEEQPLEVEPDRVQPTLEKSSSEAEWSAPETWPIQERLLVDEPSTKVMPVKEELLTEIEPSEQATESSTDEKAFSEIKHEAEAGPGKEVKPAPEEPILKKSVEEKPTLESSLRHNNRAAHAEVNPNVENELAPEPVLGVEPAKETSNSETAGLLGKIRPAEGENHNGDLQATHDIAHGQTANNLEPEETALEELVAEPKDIAKELPVEESAVNKRIMDETSAKPANDSIAKVPVDHTTAVHEPILEQPAPEEATVEEITMHELSRKSEPPIENTGIEEPITESKAVIAEPAIEEPVTHEPIIDDALLNELAVGKSVAEEPVMHQSSLEESVADEKGVDKSTMENQIAELLVEDTDTTARESPMQKGLVEDSTIREPVTASKPIIEGTHLVEPHKDKMPLSEDKTSGKRSLHASTVGEPVIEAESIEDETISDEPLATESEIENGLDVEREIKPASDSKLAEDVEPPIAEAALEEPSTTAEVRPEIKPNAKMLEAEIEHEGDTIHESKDELYTKIKQSPKIDTTGAEPVNKEPLVHSLITQTHEPLVSDHAVREQLQDKQVVDERIAEETTPKREMEDPIPSPPTKTMPARVDSGIEVDSPTDIKPNVDAIPLRAVVEDTATGDNSGDRSIEASIVKEPMVQSLNLEEPATETRMHTAKATVGEPVAAAGLASKEAADEPQSAEAEQAEKDAAVHEPVENDHFSHAVDEVGAENEPGTKAESTRENPLSKLKHVMENLFHKAPAGDDTIEDTPIAGELTTATHATKDLHVEAKPATKEQHTRVDSGIDIETSKKEPIGKLDPVVEVKPAPEFDVGLDGEAA